MGIGRYVISDSLVRSIDELCIAWNKTDLIFLQIIKTSVYTSCINTSVCRAFVDKILRSSNKLYGNKRHCFRSVTLIRIGHPQLWKIELDIYSKWIHIIVQLMHASCGGSFIASSMCNQHSQFQALRYKYLLWLLTLCRWTGMLQGLYVQVWETCQLGCSIAGIW